MLFGRTAADLATNAVTLAVMLLIGFAVGFRPTEPVYAVALAVVLVLGFAYVSWISAFVGIAVRDPETAQSVGFIWVFTARLPRLRQLLESVELAGAEALIEGPAATRRLSEALQLAHEPTSTESTQAPGRRHAGRLLTQT